MSVENNNQTDLPAMPRSIQASGSALRKIRNKALNKANCVRYRQDIRHLHALFDSDSLKPVLTEFPAILEKPFKPYVCADWDFHTRVEQIVTHFRFVEKTFGEQAVKIYKQSGFELFNFTDNDEKLYRVELFQGFQNEGAMGIRLCDSEQREVYTLTFHISGDAEPEFIVGAIQGPNDLIPNRRELITQLTRSMHGLRPKALMLEVLYLVALAMGITTIHGVSNAGHIHQSNYFSNAKRSQMLFDFDAFWREFLAEKESAQRFKLAKTIARKDLETLKSKKRSLYRKRYAWLDDAAQQIGVAMQSLLQTSPHRHASAAPYIDIAA